MKKIWFSLVVVAVIAAAFATTSAVFAQANGPQTPAYGAGYGRGARGAGILANGGQTGILHDELVSVYAARLGLTAADLNARLTAGETLSAIALEKGLSLDEFRALLTEARSQAVDAAVASGELTQDQADWLKTRGAGIPAGGRGQAGRGMNRAGLMLNPDCPLAQ